MTPSKWIKSTNAIELGDEELQNRLDDVKTELDKMDEELQAKDNELQRTIICIVLCVLICLYVAFMVWYTIDRKRIRK